MSKIYEALKRAESEREQALSMGELHRRESLAPTSSSLVRIGSDGESAEEYRRLRANVLVNTGITELHTILVTSARHGEGVTRVALGLASTLASEQARVLLFEANLRSPSLARLAQVKNGAGLAEFFRGDLRAEDMVVQSDLLGLSVVHAGVTPVVIDCESIGTGLARLQPSFDFVIIDAPPVNRYADTPLLAAKVDGVILVVGADETPLAEAEAAKRNLDRVGARILGVVLNRRQLYVPRLIEALLH